MCDTLVALPERTSSGNLIFGKNSDREPLEAQAVAHFPRQFPKEKLLNCTYISVPQVELTREVILSKPFQMWGAEMGVNEHGVVIGNEAVFTNIKFDEKKVGLTGMDLLRLALERSSSAREALKVITQLLAEYGQNACGGYQKRNFYYHNSFLIADPCEAYILETAGKSWAYRQINSIGSISNGLTLEENYEEAHFEKEARTLQGIFSGKKESFRGRFSDLIYTTAGKSKLRQACTTGFLEKRNQLEVTDFFQALRQHEREDFNPKKATTASICMHATGFTNPSDTTGSMVAEIRKDAPSTIWLTGTSHPCMSVYVPFFLGESFDLKLLSPSEEPDQSLWWQAKKLHEKICEDYGKKQPIVRQQLDLLQESWLKKESQLLQNKASNSDLKNLTLRCLEEYKEWIGNFS
ncbi:carcinine hydrolase/isopenicillin-N N-acyltransferase family protein [Algoriphagus taiwanensis]|uniref:Acyl-CoA--6-aminopenicillanic acid acyltransferase n=1 Tax=Algoriphagus taiwanensis TaxID=1445656 RepID=A0ABQ6Q2Y5_9BACT|nr:acyl-CoA--6-aminopenicillanic acid acyltransferase [Algoriphagus taiwanensis]